MSFYSMNSVTEDTGLSRHISVMGNAIVEYHWGFVLLVSLSKNSNISRNQRYERSYSKSIFEISYLCYLISLSIIIIYINFFIRFIFSFIKNGKLLHYVLFCVWGRLNTVAAYNYDILINSAKLLKQNLTSTLCRR